MKIELSNSMEKLFLEYKNLYQRVLDISDDKMTDDEIILIALLRGIDYVKYML